MFTSDPGAVTEMTGCEMTWEVDGDEYRIVRFTDVPTADGERVLFLQELLGCSRLEAEHAYRVLVEDGEFIVSVEDDIASL